jgi:hypothetical protein
MRSAQERVAKLFKRQINRRSEMVTTDDGNKSREVIWGGRLMGASMRARCARENAQRAIREASRAEAEVRSVRMEG